MLEEDYYQDNEHTSFMHLSLRDQNYDFDDVFWKICNVKSGSITTVMILRPDNDDDQQYLLILSNEWSIDERKIRLWWCNAYLRLNSWDCLWLEILRTWSTYCRIFGLIRFVIDKCKIIWQMTDYVCIFYREEMM